MNRREFLKTSAVAAATAAVSSSGATPAAAALPAPAEFKLSSQIWVLPGKNDQEKVDNLIKWGGVGIELPAGFNVTDVQKMLDGTPVKVSAICAADGPYIVRDEKQRRKAVDNAKHLLEQTRHALERIDAGSYGDCESCGTPIGKMRLQAFPRATLCMTCKQKQERR